MALGAWKAGSSRCSSVIVTIPLVLMASDIPLRAALLSTEPQNSNVRNKLSSTWFIALMSDIQRCAEPVKGEETASKSHEIKTKINRRRHKISGQMMDTTARDVAICVWDCCSPASACVWFVNNYEEGWSIGSPSAPKPPINTHSHVHRMQDAVTAF